MRNSQRGSVATFLLVGLVLAIIAVGGISYVQHQNDNGGNIAKNPPVTSRPAPLPTPSKPSKNNNKPKKSQPPSPSPSVGRKSPVPMPETGPTDAVPTILAAGLFTGLIVAYIRSARSTRGSFLD